MSRVVRVRLAWFVLTLVLWSDGRAGAQRPDAEAEARTAFEAGREAYDRGRFDEALTQFERAYHLSGHYQLLFNIGRAAESEGEVRLAVAAYEAYLERAQEADNREFAQSRLAKLRPQNGTPAQGKSAPAFAAPALEAAPLPSHTEVDVLDVQARSPFRAYGGLYLGVGGNVDQRIPGVVSAKPDLNSSYGLQAGAEWLPNRYLGLGVELRAFWYIAEDDAESSISRDFAFDLMLKPTARYPLARIPLELYVGLPVGLTVSVLSSPDSDYAWDEKLGPNLGAIAGATYFFNQYVGANLEVGAHWHWYKATYEERGDEVSFTLKQGLIAVNAMFAIGQPQR